MQAPLYALLHPTTCEAGSGISVYTVVTVRKACMPGGPVQGLVIGTCLCRPAVHQIQRLQLPE